MCYLCFKDNPLRAINDRSTPEYKRLRAKELKELLKDADDTNLCVEGDERVKYLRDEQYKIAQQL